MLAECEHAWLSGLSDLGDTWALFVCGRRHRIYADAIRLTDAKRPLASSHLARLTFLLAIATASVACSSEEDSANASESTFCRDVDREVLVDEQLSPGIPSSAFVVEAEDHVWVGLIADSDVSPSALFSMVTGLYVIDEGAPVEYSRDGTGAVVTDAAHLDFAEQAQFVRFDDRPGAFQIWSVKSPQVQVVRCPPQ